ncbi:hypothetical protein ACFQU7_20380 [Pseudoroseomonas wenyumeiae]
MTSNNLRTILNLVLPILQPVIGALAPVFGIGMTMQEMSAGSETPSPPLAMPSPSGGDLHARHRLGHLAGIAGGAGQRGGAAAGLAAGGAFACSNLWMLLSQLTGNGWHLVVVILALLACVLAAFFIARAEPGQGWVDTWIIYPSPAFSPAGSRRPPSSISPARRCSPASSAMRG